MKKIALPVTFSNQIDNHFGHCEMYSVYSISDTSEILGIQTINSEQGCGCKSNIAATLAAQGVTVMLAGGIGNGAINVLNAHGIEVIRGCTGNATEAVTEYLTGNLNDSGESCRQHEHHQGQGHQCNH
jgi:predicted Fe-Mo cluster-binding NifX family protein